MLCKLTPYRKIVNLFTKVISIIDAIMLKLLIRINSLCDNEKEKVKNA